MAEHKTIKGSVKLEDIKILIPQCPGCGHEHEFNLTRPAQTRNCGHGQGTFKVTVVNRTGYLEVAVKFIDVQYKEEDITQNTVITVQRSVS